MASPFHFGKDILGRRDWVGRGKCGRGGVRRGKWKGWERGKGRGRHLEDTGNTKCNLTNAFQCDTIDLRFYNRLLICIGTVHMYCLDNKRCCEFIESEWGI